MIERLFAITGYLCTALMVYGLGALWWAPDAPWATVPVYAGLVVLMLTPVTRVAIACGRYLRAGDRLSAALTFAILLIIALSAWAAAR